MKGSDDYDSHFTHDSYIFMTYISVCISSLDLCVYVSIIQTVYRPI